MTSVCSISSSVRLLSRRCTRPCHTTILPAVLLRLSPLRPVSGRPTASCAFSTYTSRRLPLHKSQRHLPSHTASPASNTSLTSSSSTSLFLLPRRHANIHVTDTTADEFSRQFDRLSDTIQHTFDRPDIADGDVDLSYSNGVLSIRTAQHGTYIINQHNVTRQVWLSSPISGPSKYNWHRERAAAGARGGSERQGQWCNERDVSRDLMTLLEREFGTVFGKDVKFDEPF